MSSQRGLSFQLAGSKRTAAGSAAANAPRKPVSVKDLFSGDSDDEEQPVVELKKSRVLASGEAIPAAPADPEVKRAADKLAEFVARNGRGFEEVTRTRNAGDATFKFLQDKFCSDYKYYEHKVKEFGGTSGAAASGSVAGSGTYSSLPSRASHSFDASSASAGRPSHVFHRSADPYQPASASMPARVEMGRQHTTYQQAAGDSVAAMNAYMQMAAKKEHKKHSVGTQEEPAAPAVANLKETSFDRRKVTAVHKPDGAKGHHMQDFIPPEEMARFLAKCGDDKSAALAAALEERNAIGADNIGHKLLQKMGWKEGEGIGSSGTGIAVPIKATGIKQDNLGVGAAAVGEVADDDDVYEQYRKRMMLGYKFRPNPLGNPRKAYY